VYVFAIVCIFVIVNVCDCGGVPYGDGGLMVDDLLIDIDIAIDYEACASIDIVIVIEAEIRLDIEYCY